MSNKAAMQHNALPEMLRESTAEVKNKNLFKSFSRRCPRRLGKSSGHTGLQKGDRKDL